MSFNGELASCLLKLFKKNIYLVVADLIAACRIFSVVTQALVPRLWVEPVPPAL